MKMHQHPRTSYTWFLLPAMAALTVIAGCSKQLQTTYMPVPPPAAIVAAPDSRAIFLQDAAADPRVGNRSWQGIPSVAATANGKQIYVAWYSGGAGEGPGNYVTVALSLDKARSWREDALVVYPADPSQARMYDPGLWRDRFGIIRLTWTKSEQFWDGVGGVWTTPLYWNGQQVETGAVRFLANGVMLNKPTYIPSRAAMLYPISWWNFAPSDPARQGTYIYQGAYGNGAIPQESLQPIGKIAIPDSLRTFDEHQLVETSDDGNLLCMVRTWGGIYYARSADYGVHWGKPAPFTAVGATTASRFHISKLQSGKLLLIINNSTARTNLTAYISSNGGKTWPHKLVLDQRSNISYPDAIQTNDGNIHVVYDRERFSSKDILYCRFSEKDLLTSNAKGIVRVKVNK